MVVLGGQHKGLILSTVNLSGTDLNVHSLLYQDSFKALGDNLIERHTERNWDCYDKLNQFWNVIYNILIPKVTFTRINMRTVNELLWWQSYDFLYAR